MKLTPAIRSQNKSTQGQLNTNNKSTNKKRLATLKNHEQQENKKAHSSQSELAELLSSFFAQLSLSKLAKVISNGSKSFKAQRTKSKWLILMVFVVFVVFFSLHLASCASLSTSNDLNNARLQVDTDTNDHGNDNEPSNHQTIVYRLIDTSVPSDREEFSIANNNDDFEEQLANDEGQFVDSIISEDDNDVSIQRRRMNKQRNLEPEPWNRKQPMKRKVLALKEPKLEGNENKLITNANNDNEPSDLDFSTELDDNGNFDDLGQTTRNRRRKSRELIDNLLDTLASESVGHRALLSELADDAAGRLYVPTQQQQQQQQQLTQDVSQSAAPSDFESDSVASHDSTSLSSSANLLQPPPILSPEAHVSIDSDAEDNSQVAFVVPSSSLSSTSPLASSVGNEKSGKLTIGAEQSLPGSGESFHVPDDIDLAPVFSAHSGVRRGRRNSFNELPSYLTQRVRGPANLKDIIVVNYAENTNRNDDAEDFTPDDYVMANLRRLQIAGGLSSYVTAPLTALRNLQLRQTQTQTQTQEQEQEQGQQAFDGSQLIKALVARNNLLHQRAALLANSVSSLRIGPKLGVRSQAEAGNPESKYTSSMLVAFTCAFFAIFVASLMLLLVRRKSKSTLESTQQRHKQQQQQVDEALGDSLSEDLDELCATRTTDSSSTRWTLQVPWKKVARCQTSAQTPTQSAHTTSQTMSGCLVGVGGGEKSESIAGSLGSRFNRLIEFKNPISTQQLETSHTEQQQPAPPKYETVYNSCSAPFDSSQNKQLRSSHSYIKSLIDVLSRGVHRGAVATTSIAQNKLEAEAPSELCGKVNEAAAKANDPSSKSNTEDLEVCVAQMDISAAHLILGYMERHLEDRDRLKRDWNELCQGQKAQVASIKTLARVALSPTNLNKNNSPSLAVPFDKNRVKLKAHLADQLAASASCQISSQTLPSFGSDYINASYIYDFDPKAPTHILAQAPTDATLPLFWQMIWDEHVSVIVMLTRLAENGSQMSCCYWPTLQATASGPIKQTSPSSSNSSRRESNSSLICKSNEQQASNFDETNNKTLTYVISGSNLTLEVHFVSEHVTCNDFVVRNMCLVNKLTKETRNITQFHYLAWPEFGVPQNSRSLLRFRRKVNKCYKKPKSPLLVHCSDGVGRSGTYVLIDTILNRISRGAKEINIAATLEHLREQRMNLVHNATQFEFVLVALADEIQFILDALPK